MATASDCNGCGKQAVNFCEDCPGLLCAACLCDHELTTAFSTHRLADLSKKTQEGGVIQYILCPDHHVYIKYYCHDCRRGMCRLCVPQNHQKHQAEPLSSLVVTRRAALKEAIKDLQSMVSELDSKKREPGRMQAEAESTIAAAEDEFKLHIARCTAAIQSWEEKTKADFEDRRLGLSKGVERMLGMRNSHHSRIKCLEDEINALMCLDRPLEVVERTESIVKVVESLKGKSIGIQHGTFVKGARFVPDSLPSGMGDLQEVNIGPGSDVEQLTFWAKAARGSGVGELLSPCDVLLLPGGELLLADWGNGRVQRFLSSGDMPAVLLQDLNPERLAADGDVLMVSDDKRKAVLSFTMDANVIREWKPPEVDRPWGLAVNRDSSRVVTDYANSTGFIYSADEVWKAGFGGYGGCRTQEPWLLNLPTYVCCDLHGRILISDCNNHAVKIFDSNGDFLSAFGSRGTADGQLRYPRGLCIDSSNNIVIADWGNDRVCQFSPDGKFICHIFSKDNSDQFGWPYGISYLSGTFNDGRPRLAITTEGPDALLTIPYHHTSDPLPNHLNFQDDQISQSTDQIDTIESNDQHGVVVKDTYIQWTSEIESDSEPIASGRRSNLRRTAHGSGAGRSKSENSQSISSSSVEHEAEHSLLSTPEETIPSHNPTGQIPPKSLRHRASEQSLNESLEDTSRRGASPLDTRTNSSGSGSFELDEESPDLINTSYTPSIGESKPKRKSKTRSKKSKERAKPSKDHITYQTSLESIPERLSYSSEGSDSSEKGKARSSMRPSSVNSSPGCDDPNEVRFNTCGSKETNMYNREDVGGSRRSLEGEIGTGEGEIIPYEF